MNSQLALDHTEALALPLKLLGTTTSKATGDPLALASPSKDLNPPARLVKLKTLGQLSHAVATSELQLRSCATYDASELSASL